MKADLLLAGALWGMLPFLFWHRQGRALRAWVWGAACVAAVLAAGGPRGETGAALFAWGAAALVPLAFDGARRAADRRFRQAQRATRRKAREATDAAVAQRSALDALQGPLDRMQNRFALVQTMATQLDTTGILRSLGELWADIPHVRRCVLLQRLPNGNWSPALARGVEKPEAWAAFVNERPALARSRRARRFTALDRYPELATLGAGPAPFLTIPFAWADDVMALGILEADGAASDEVWEGFQVERKLVSIGLRRAFLYDLMSERSRHDGLTGAFLRRPFMERVEEALKKRQRYRAPCALAVLDLDHFKSLNDRFGHLAGDRALVHLAQAARRLSVPGVTLGRLGGDEFALLLELPAFEESLGWVERFVDEVRRHPPREGDQDLPVTVSAGLAEAPVDRISVDDLAQRADRALYVAKARGRDRVAVFSQNAVEVR